MTDKTLHTVQLGMVLVVALVLILFAHQWIAPELVFTTMIAGVSGIIATRIAANGYQKPPPPTGTP